ncbi:MAG: hypothetical protein M1814_005305 [Vezdaea aestivalis]|nr:MAG: hypothetical protein M1814_005305 [Vezdaea aestivalis]
MKVVTPKDGDITNAEVLSHLREMRTRYQTQAQKSHPSTPLKSGNLETVIRELEEYLTSPASPLESETAPDLGQIAEFVGATLPFELTKGEVLQMLNLRPETIPVLDTIVEELDQRLVEERQLDLLRVVRRVLKSSFVTPEPEGEEVVEEGTTGV